MILISRKARKKRPNDVAENMEGMSVVFYPFIILHTHTHTHNVAAAMQVDQVDTKTVERTVEETRSNSYNKRPSLKKEEEETSRDFIDTQLPPAIRKKRPGNGSGKKQKTCQ